ncbi:DNA repair protein RAD51 homolog 3-like [Anopheles bellator]|uniref:DNA repair protein RAD51 homolog 3-like n=1 Tax=Anopheles bellator TaxID=139047 RepID=UPI002647A03E|nr:DNA repair protein RAD51 homolog 3-like [Anopheles bellator]
MFKFDAYDLLNEECDRGGILTFCKDLDLVLGCGIAQGLITELCGRPGSGKTQFCLQLSVNVQIPRQLGGLEGRVAYLDTKYGFSPQRIQEMAKACLDHCTKMPCFLRRNDKQEIMAGFTLDSVVNNILYTHVRNCSHILEAIAVLQNKCYAGEKIRLIIIDSLSFVVRNTIPQTLERVTRLHEILTELHKLAHRFGCAVVVTNDVTTRIADSKQPCNDIQIVPALGGSHSHKINQRIVLGRDETDGQQHLNRYIAAVEKSPTTPQIAVAFTIETVGIRNVRRGRKQL